MNILCKLFGHDIEHWWDMERKIFVPICQRCGHKGDHIKKPRKPWPPKLMTRKGVGNE